MNIETQLKAIESDVNEIKENVQKVYDAGAKSEYDKFWDSCQGKGRRTYYTHAFSGIGWNDTTFKPKYDIVPVGSYCCVGMFNSASIKNLKQILIDCDVTMDLSKASPLIQVFQSDSITTLPKIDMSSCKDGNSYTFYSSSLKSIDELVVNENVVFDSTTFGNASSLTNLKISGVIGKSLSLSSSPLSVESAKSVINALKNYAGTSNNLKYKLALKPTVWTALNNAEAPPSGDTWQLYVNSLGWNCA
jgi:hypothetical protein